METKIYTPEQLANYKDTRKLLKKSETFRFDHMVIANQTLKVITASNLDPLVKKVMTMKLSAPIFTGMPRSNLSIALELGIREYEVNEAEALGVLKVTEILNDACLPEKIEQFNKDKLVKEAVQNLGKSGNGILEGAM